MGQRYVRPVAGGVAHQRGAHEPKKSGSRSYRRISDYVTGWLAIIPAPLPLAGCNQVWPSWHLSCLLRL